MRASERRASGVVVDVVARSLPSSLPPSLPPPPLLNHGAPFRNLSFIIRPPDMQKARKDQLVVAPACPVRPFVPPSSARSHAAPSLLPPSLPRPAHSTGYLCKGLREANSRPPKTRCVHAVCFAFRNCQSQALALHFRSGAGEAFLPPSGTATIAHPRRTGAPTRTPLA